MSEGPVVVREDWGCGGRAALVELNRPGALNALSEPLMGALADALLRLSDGGSCRVAVVTGRGRAFAAGADIAEMERDTPVSKVMGDRFRHWDRLRQVGIPLVAAVNGYALGGGCELAMACDVAVAAEEAVFGQPEVSIGTMPGAGGTQRLPRALGKARAMYHVLTGEPIPAAEALRLGLVARVVPGAALMGEALAVAGAIASKPPVAVRLAKEAVNKAFETSLRDGMEFERRNFYLTFASRDQKEGMRAFLEKREPRYTGA